MKNRHHKIETSNKRQLIYWSAFIITYLPTPVLKAEFKFITVVVSVFDIPNCANFARNIKPNC